jgi:hypothetical protein
VDNFGYYFIHRIIQKVFHRAIFKFKFIKMNLMFRKAANSGKWCDDSDG